LITSALHASRNIIIVKARQTHSIGKVKGVIHALKALIGVVWAHNLTMWGHWRLGLGKMQSAKTRNQNCNN
jgi:hypothetical protein